MQSSNLPADILAHEFIDTVAAVRVCIEKGKVNDSIRALEQLEKDMWLLLVSVEIKEPPFQVQMASENL